MMKYEIASREMILLSLDKDDYVNQSIKNLFAKESLNSGWISGIGAIYNIEIGYYDINLKEYCKKKIPEEHEMTSLTGNVSFVESEYFIHTHITISDIECSSFGGHLFEAQIAAAGEFKIDLIDKKINRKYSNEIGLNLWCLNNENN